jgi:benzoate/toluate 1,2-dioxygenase beta subunit
MDGSATLMSGGDVSGAELLDWLAAEREVIAWVEAEAELLDGAGFEAWDELWEPDGVYWMPLSLSHDDPELQMALIYDDRPAISRRVDRLSGRLAYALQPAAQVSRIVGNVKVKVADGDLIEVRSRFMMMISRRGEPVVLGGRMLHRLRRRSDGFGMVLKRVDLVGADGLFENFTVVL